MQHSKSVTVLSIAAVMLALVLGLFVSPAEAVGPLKRSIGGTVFLDHDGNGQRDATDRGLAGVTVSLRGPRRLDTITDECGNFHFGRLPPGIYKITEVNPAGYLSTTPDTDKVFLLRDAKAAHVDFGDALPISMYGAVFHDADLDGQFAFFETGIGDVNITIYDDADGDGELDSTEPALARAQTDSQGNYLFTGLLPGRRIVVETDPVGYVSTTPNVVAVTLMSDEAGGGTGIDFGDIPSTTADTSATGR